MLAFDGLVRGRLIEIVDGLTVVVPQGRCRVQIHEGLVSVSWTREGAKAGSVLLKAHRLEEYLDAGVILMIDPAQLCNG